MTRGSCSIFKYLQQAKSYANALVATGEPVSNTDIISADLRGLGPEYDVLLVAIETYPTLLDLSAIHSWLLTFKAYHGSIMQPSPAASLATQTLHSMPLLLNNNNRGCGHSVHCQSYCQTLVS